MADEDLSKLKIDKTQSTYRTTKKKRRTLIYVAGAVALLIIILALTGFFSPAVNVQTATVSMVYPSQTFTILNASGYVVAQKKSAVAAKVTGRLISLYVEEGSKIKKGQVLAQLENEDLVASRRQAAANLDVAATNFDQAKAELTDAKLAFEREKELLAKEYTARASFDSAQARYKKAVAGAAGAEASIKAARAALAGVDVSLQYTRIESPFDAVVLTKDADVGDIVTPLGAATNAKASVVTIADMSSLQVEADVSESNIEKLKVDQPCEIQLDAIPSERFPGSVHMIVPTADRTKATVMVKVKFDNLDPRVLPEMSAKVAFLSRKAGKGEEKPRIAVSSTAIVENSGKKNIFIVKNNKAVKTPVTAGEPLGDMVEISGGVAVGDKIVVRPPKNLRNNVPVKISEQ